MLQIMNQINERIAMNSDNLEEVLESNRTYIVEVQ